MATATLPPKTSNPSISNSAGNAKTVASKRKSHTPRRSAVSAELAQIALRQISAGFRAGAVGTLVIFLLLSGKRPDAAEVAWTTATVLTALGGATFASKALAVGRHRFAYARLAALPHVISALSAPLVFQPSPHSLRGVLIVGQLLVLVILYSVMFAPDISLSLGVILGSAFMVPLTVSSLQPWSIGSRWIVSGGICCVLVPVALTVSRPLRSSVSFELSNRQLVADLRAANAELEKFASMDPLTSTWNRRGLDEAMSHAGQVGLLYVDIDHFKTINDSHGHAAGDRVLVAVAEILSRTVRPSDVVARVGGDEFVLLIPGASGTDLEKVAKRIHDRMSKTTDIVTVSIGGTTGDLASEGVGVVCERADAQLYQAKREGRDRVCISA